MMNVLRDGRSERGTARVGKRHDLKTVRWYVLTLPTTGVARRDRISPAKSLDAELLCGGEEGGRKDGQHETTPAVQLRVCPVLG